MCTSSSTKGFQQQVQRGPLLARRDMDTAARGAERLNTHYSGRPGFIIDISSSVSVPSTWLKESGWKKLLRQSKDVVRLERQTKKHVVPSCREAAGNSLPYKLFPCLYDLRVELQEYLWTSRPVILTKRNVRPRCGLENTTKDILCWLVIRL